jgi:uncharacterized membrane protein SirB2
MCGLSPIELIFVSIAACLLVIAVVLLVRSARRVDPVWVRICPDCGRTVLIVYESCPDCGRRLPPDDSPAQ